MTVRTIAARALLSVGSLAVALLALEGVWRVAGLAPPPRPRVEGRDVRPSPDPALGYETLPGGCRTMVFRDVRGGPERRVEHHVNSRGLRGPELSAAALAQAFRISCVGDSFTYGHGVGDDETWPRALDR